MKEIPQIDKIFHKLQIKRAELQHPLDRLDEPYWTNGKRIKVVAYCGNCGHYRAKADLKIGKRGQVLCLYCGCQVRIKPRVYRQQRYKRQKQLEIMEKKKKREEVTRKVENYKNDEER